MDTVCVLVSLRDAAPVKYLNAWPCWPQPWAIEPSTPDFGLVFSHGVSYRQGKSWHGTLGTKKGFCAASHLQCDIIHYLILCSTIGGNNLPRSVSADRTWPQMIPKHFGNHGKTARRRDGKTARRQAAMKHAGHMSHMYYTGHMTWIRITWNDMKSGVCF